MPTPKWVGKVERGRLTLADREQFDKYLTGLQGVVEVIVRPFKKKRSDQQNAYLWGVCYKILSEWNGNTPEEWHELCKQWFLPPHTVMFKGKEYVIQLTTTTKNTKEFAEYVDRIIQFAAEDGVVIPPPSQVDL